MMQNLQLYRGKKGMDTMFDHNEDWNDYLIYLQMCLKFIIIFNYVIYIYMYIYIYSKCKHYEHFRYVSALLSLFAVTCAW